MAKKGESGSSFILSLCHMDMAYTASHTASDFYNVRNMFDLLLIDKTEEQRGRKEKDLEIKSREQRDHGEMSDLRSVEVAPLVNS